MDDARETAADGHRPNWVAIAERNSRSVQTTIGWIFWDPGAAARYTALGLPEAFAGPLGYAAARCAPLAPAGPEAVIAAFGSISPVAINALYQVIDEGGDFTPFWDARHEAVAEGLRAYAPAMVAPLAALGPQLWPVVDALPSVGRVLFAAYRAMPRSDDPLISGWQAVNCIREWRGDTHWAVVVAEGLTHPEASILHNAWLGYEPDWLARSRGTSDEDLAAGWDRLQAKGVVVDGVVTDAGLAIRQRIERRTDELTTTPWELLGEAASVRFAEEFEPPCVELLARVDVTAGPNYQPASRTRRDPRVAELAAEL